MAGRVRERGCGRQGEGEGLRQARRGDAAGRVRERGLNNICNSVLLINE